MNLFFLITNEIKFTHHQSFHYMKGLLNSGFE